MKIQIAIAQPEPKMQEKALIQFIQRASKEDVDLILFPEGFLPSYTDERLITLDHPIIRLIKKITEQHQIAVATGIKEKQGNNKHLSLILVHCGEIKAVHRKVILADFEQKIFDQGELDEAFPVEEIKGLGRIGLALCYENLFPEVYRILKQKGAQIVLGPSGFGMKGNFYNRQIDYHDQWLTILRANAIQSQVFMVCATNAVGKKLMGVVIDPVGHVTLDADDQEYAKCALDLSLLEKTRKKLLPEALEVDFFKIPSRINEIQQGEHFA